MKEELVKEITALSETDLASLYEALHGKIEILEDDYVDGLAEMTLLKNELFRERKVIQALEIQQTAINKRIDQITQERIRQTMVDHYTQRLNEKVNLLQHSDNSYANAIGGRLDEAIPYLAEYIPEIIEPEFDQIGNRGNEGRINVKFGNDNVRLFITGDGFTGAIYNPKQNSSELAVLKLIQSNLTAPDGFEFDPHLVGIAVFNGHPDKLTTFCVASEKNVTKGVRLRTFSLEIADGTSLVEHLHEKMGKILSEGVVILPKRTA